MFEGKCRAIQSQSLLGGENLGRNGCQWWRRKVEIPVFDPLGYQEMLVSVLVGDNGYPFGVQPLIAVRVIEVPVGIDQVSDRIPAEAVGGFQDTGA
jgi:hypothetical protein